jgi:hypothetical protein
VTSRDPKAEPAGFTPGDEDADDDQLKSLRAVWLSMPDEDPPVRGLASLMEAARVKADEMAQPSLWQRIAALLRRPPVLALATVLVLIGGAVFIGQRKDKLSHAPEVSLEQRDTAQGSAPAQTIAPAPEKNDEQPAAAPSAATHGDPSAAATAGDSSAPATPGDPNATRLDNNVERAPPRNRRPTPRAEPKSTTTRGLTDSEDGKDTFARDKAFDGELSEGAKQETVTGGFAQSPPAEAPTPTTKPQPKSGATKPADAPKTGATKPADAPTVDSTGVTAAPESTREESTRAPQYVAQAKSAAARGDCVAARTLMKRVAKEDAGAYRNALASDGALKKCVGVVAH